MVIALQVDEVEGLINAVSSASQIANQYMAGFMAVIILLMIAGGLVITVVISRAVTRIIDNNSANQKDDSTLQQKILDNWAQDRVDYREVAQSIRELTATINPFVKNISDLIPALSLSTRQILDSQEAVSATVSEWTTQMHELKAMVRASADCKPDTATIIQAIDDASNRILKVIELNPPPTVPTTLPTKQKPPEDDGIVTLPKASGE